jgi:predicted GIY-YIG superfamily endonuclease
MTQVSTCLFVYLVIPKSRTFPKANAEMSGPDQPGWFVYVLRNKKTGEVYTGCSNDVKERIKTHQTHPTRGAKTTRRWVAKHGPAVVCLFAQVGPMTKSAAQSLEHKWKRTTAGTGSVEVRPPSPQCFSLLA